MTLSLKPSDATESGLTSQYKAPDGGWGWVVVASSLIIHIVMDGITYSLGTYLTIFTENFGISHAEASFVHSLLPAITLSCGPIASILTNKLGCRLTTIIGSFIAFFGFFLSCFVRKFFLLYLTVGVIVGFGFGLIYVPAIVSVGYYFEKRRSLAIGIAVCGSGIGTFVLSPVNRILVDNYGWAGAFLIKSGLCLNLCVCGALMKPVFVEPSEILKRSKAKQKQQLIQNENDANNVDYKHSHENMEVTYRPKPKILVSDDKNKIIYQLNSMNMSDPNNLNGNGGELLANYSQNESDTQLTKCVASQPSIKSLKRSTMGEVRGVGNGIMYGNNGANGVDAAEMAKSMPMLLSDQQAMDANKNIYHTAEANNVMSLVSKSTNSALDILAQMKSLQNIPVSFYESTKNKDDMLKSSNNEENSKNQRTTHSIKSISIKLVEKISESIDFSLFKNILFLFFIISNFLTSLGFNVPYIYIVDQATLLKIKPELADLLLSTIGISNSIGRLVLGVLGDLKSINRIYLYSAVLSICGISTIIEPFCYNFSSLFIYSIVFGFTSGGYVSLTSVLLVDLLGLDKLTNAFGILLVFQGIATSIGPPLVGKMFDSFNSYVIAFVITGIMIAISGAMCFLIPLIQFYSKKKMSNVDEKTATN